MLDTRRTRAIAVLLLLGVLFGVFVWHGTLEPNPRQGRYPGVDEVVQRPSDQLRETVVVSGTVVETTPMVLEVEYSVVVDGSSESGTLLVTVVDPPGWAEKGQEVQVFGTLIDERTVRATRVVASGSYPGYMIAVSFLAGLWVLARLNTHWRFESSDASIRRRSSPRRLSELFGERIGRFVESGTTSEGEDDDA